MIDYVTAHPTHFVYIPDGKYSNNWTGVLNHYLWGNPEGYNYPRQSQTYKSVFDPCPNGYRVSPKDIWIAFTDSNGGRTIDTNKEETYAGNIFNILNLSSNRQTTTIATQRGLFCCYGVNDDGSRKWQQEPADFYPNQGRRERQSGAIAALTDGGWYWSNSPSSNSAASAGRFGFISTTMDILAADGYGRGFGVRCVKEQ